MNRADLVARHHPDQSEEGRSCAACGRPWPCDVAVLSEAPDSFVDVLAAYLVPSEPLSASHLRDLGRLERCLLCGRTSPIWSEPDQRRPVLHEPDCVAVRLMAVAAAAAGGARADAVATRNALVRAFLWHPTGRMTEIEALEALDAVQAATA